MANNLNIGVTRAQQVSSPKNTRFFIKGDQNFSGSSGYEGSLRINNRAFLTTWTDSPRTQPMLTYFFFNKRQDSLKIYKLYERCRFRTRWTGSSRTDSYQDISKIALTQGGFVYRPLDHNFMSWGLTMGLKVEKSQRKHNYFIPPEGQLLICHLYRCTKWP